MAILYFLGLIYAIIVLFNPYVHWYITVGWQLNGAEPSEVALKAYSAFAGMGAFIFFLAFISAF